MEPHAKMLELQKWNHSSLHQMTDLTPDYDHISQDMLHVRWFNQ
jgi:hypothetical protein